LKLNSDTLITLLFFLALKVGFSQFEKVVYTGFIQTIDSAVFPYQINISRIGNNISGYSISDKGGKSETKSEFEILKSGQNYIFKENKIVYTKADYSSFDDFCLVSFYLREKEIFNSNKLSLDFKGLFSDGSACIDGSITLVNNKFIEKRLDRIENKISNNRIIQKKFGDTIKKIEKKIDDLKKDFVSNKEVSLLKDDKLKFNIYESYKVYIADFGFYDNDKISVEINDNISNEVIITEKRKYFSIDKKQRKNIIKITGIDFGEVPPITAQIVIENLSKKTLHKIELSLMPKESCEIELNF
jgi:hypothetical protein